MAKLSFKFFVLGIFLGSLLFLYKLPSSSQATNLRVAVAEQRATSLVILPTFVDSTNSLKPRYGYSITNSADNAIVAYAIEEIVSLQSGSQISTTTLTHLPAKRLLLGPGASRQEEGGTGKTYDSLPTLITLSVDFIEFADGSRWGKDQVKSGERLDGERAGARAALKKYREIKSVGGVKKLVETFEASTAIVAEDKNKSSNWLLGFHHGSAVVRTRLRKAKTRGGEAEVEKELTKPYDSTEGRLEPW
jgi:hypothetical protein